MLCGLLESPFDDSQSSSTAHPEFCRLLIVKQHPPKVIEGTGDASDAQRFDHNKVAKLYLILGDCIIAVRKFKSTFVSRQWGYPPQGQRTASGEEK